jgi:hypothetical protein
MIIVRSLLKYHRHLPSESNAVGVRVKPQHHFIGVSHSCYASLDFKHAAAARVNCFILESSA